MDEGIYDRLDGFKDYFGAAQNTKARRTQGFTKEKLWAPGFSRKAAKSQRFAKGSRKLQIFGAETDASGLGLDRLEVGGDSVLRHR